MEPRIWNFERAMAHEATDETGINLRAYFDLMPDQKMQRYDPSWTDDEVIKWDDNFTEEGNLLLLCSERDVDVAEYRRVLHQAIEYRNRVRALPPDER
jgi:hypothetical protein